MAAESLYGNENRTKTKVMRAKNGRFAVLAKRKASDPNWTQIESVMDQRNAVEYAEEMEFDDEARVEAVASNGVEGELWEGEDAPENQP